MCLIIDSPAGNIIDRRLIDSGLYDNSDGWGIMSAEGGSIRINRGMKRKRFLRALDQHRGRDVTIHFRFATHGDTNIDNCHPFTFCDGNYALMHNGILSSMPTVDAGRSDTWHFANLILGPMLAGSPGLFGTDTLDKTLSGMIGKGNKLVILRADGSRMVVNRDCGLDYQGSWLSNGHSIPRAKSAIEAAGRFSDVDFLPDGYEDCAHYDRMLADHQAEMTLEDIGAMYFEDIVDLCVEDPTQVASLIQDYFLKVNR